MAAKSILTSTPPQPNSNGHGSTNEKNCICNVARMIYRPIILIAAIFILDFTAASLAYAEAAEEVAEKIIVNRINPLFVPFSRSNQGNGDFIAFIENHKVLTNSRSVLIGSNYAKLPAPPDADLLSTLQSLSNPPVMSPPLYLTWLRRAKIGGVYFLEGAGGCQSWTMFTLNGKSTTLTVTPDLFVPNVCAGDGYDSAIGYIENDAVAVQTETYTNASGEEIVQLRLEVWKSNNWSGQSETSFKFSPKQ